MLRLLRRLGDTAGSHPVFSRPEARSGARLVTSTSTPIGGFKPRPNTPFVNGTGLKPSLTLFWLFMTRQAPAP